MAKQSAFVVAIVLCLGIGIPAQECVEEGGLCGEREKCCAGVAGLTCEPRGFLEQRCVGQRRLDQCAQEGQPCGGHTHCCGDMTCEHVHGHDHEHHDHHHGECVGDTPSPTPSPVCAGEMQTCGGPGLPDTPCCGDMTCERHFMGTENLQCVPAASTTPAPVCAGEMQTCGGPGLPDTPCCGDMKCERDFMGTENLQCVPAATTSTTAPQCKARGAICGCAGCRTMTCCEGLQCLEVSGQGGQQYCVDIVGTALALMANAAPANATLAQDP